MFSKVKTENRKYLSDHAPLLIKTEHGRQFFCCNILVQMKYNGFLNNGFGCNKEQDDHYKARLSEFASRLATWAMYHEPAAICLQEGPVGPGFDIFKNNLFPIYDEYDFFTLGKGMIMLVNTSKYSVSDELTKKLDIHKLTGGLQDKCLAMVLIEKTGNKSILVVNVHADFNKPVIQDVCFLHNKVTELNIDEIIIMGDFNRNILQKSDDYSQADMYKAVENKELALFATNMEASSFIRRAKDNHPKDILPTEDDLDLLIETRDGVLSSVKASIQYESYLHSVREFEKIALLAPELTKIPPGFFEGMKPGKEYEPENHDLACRM